MNKTIQNLEKELHKEIKLLLRELKTANSKIGFEDSIKIVEKHIKWKTTDE